MSATCYKAIEAGYKAGGLPSLRDCTDVSDENTVDLCKEGTTADCANVKAMLEFRACDAVAHGTYVAGLSGCNGTEAEAVAKGYGKWKMDTEHLYKCDGVATHTCIKDKKVTPFSETLDGKVKDAKDAGFGSSGDGSSAAAGLVALAGVSLAAASMLA